MILIVPLFSIDVASSRFGANSLFKNGKEKTRDSTGVFFNIIYLTPSIEEHILS